MRYFIALFRLIIAAFALIGTYKSWTFIDFSNIVYFTHQTNILLAIVMMWAALSTLSSVKAPPQWLKGMVTLYIVITGLVSWLILPPSNPATAKYVFGIMTVTMVHVITPILASLDFLLFDEHRQLRWRYAAYWLSYFPIYLAFVLIRAAIWPHSGPKDDGSPYPYPFVDLPKIGWEQLGINIVEYLSVFAILGLILIAIDHALPALTPLSATSRK